MTRDPIAFPIWTPAEPTPPVAPRTTSVFSSFQFGRSKRAVSSKADIGQRRPVLERNTVRQSPQGRCRHCHHLGSCPITKHSQTSTIHNDSLTCFEPRPILFNDASRLLPQNQWRLFSD